MVVLFHLKASDVNKKIEENQVFHKSKIKNFDFFFNFKLGMTQLK